MSERADHWHRSLRRIARGELSEATTQTPGMLRREAVSGRATGSEKIWMGETEVEAGHSSANHHHGESETAIYVVSGHPEFVFLENGVETRLRTGPGDYIFVPPYTPHREENPGRERAIVVLARSTQEAIVVNLEGLGG